MLDLALVVWLAAAAPEALPRIPGTRFRLGMTESQVLGIAAFAEVKAPDVAGMTARQGDSRFFGIPGEATVYSRDGRLARLRFVATGVSPHSAGYVEDQLRRMGMGRDCPRDDPGDRLCDWRGPAVNVRLGIRKDRLEATIERWPPPPGTMRDSLGALAAATARPAAGVGKTTPPAGIVSGTSAGTTVPTKAVAPAATDAPATAGTHPGRDSTGDSARASAAPVATLPETLTISLASRNAPNQWPRIVSSPRLDYPAAARRESVQGVVWVLALVDTDGRVLDAAIDRGVRELDAAAVSWVSRSRFAPCELQGAPCRFRVRVAVLFTLH